MTSADIEFQNQGRISRCLKIAMPAIFDYFNELNNFGGRNPNYEKQQKVSVKEALYTNYGRINQLLAKGGQCLNYGVIDFCFMNQGTIENYGSINCLYIKQVQSCKNYGSIETIFVDNEILHASIMDSVQSTNLRAIASQYYNSKASSTPRMILLRRANLTDQPSMQPTMPRDAAVRLTSQPHPLKNLEPISATTNVNTPIASSTVQPVNSLHVAPSSITFRSIRPRLVIHPATQLSTSQPLRLMNLQPMPSTANINTPAASSIVQPSAIDPSKRVVSVVAPTPTSVVKFFSNQIALETNESFSTQDNRSSESNAIEGLENMPNSSDPLIPIQAQENTQESLINSSESVALVDDESDDDVEEIPGNVEIVDLCTETSTSTAKARSSRSAKGSSKARKGKRAVPYTVTPTKSTYETRCPICLKVVKNHEPVSTPCGHIYCQECLTESLRTRQKKNCPMCKKKLPARNMFHRIYF